MSDPDPMPFDVFAKECPSRRVFEHVTGKWGALVIGRLDAEPKRFGEIRGQIDGISDRMLAQTLRILCDDGIAARTEAAGNPVYGLTDAGTGVAGAVRRLIDAVEDAMSHGAGEVRRG
ncbi:winged helix-turn-helix transcriptional regulator [Gordonia zhaorongruii]|uniref:winged helix-turn-helix transcriptional regulator n=1 Tax=Gordonia zhaorongruii TaxID=2597659 RepID=UPI0010482763|nr:helix-turn-helix domain-containing protein [Gordonia zhaorongruii]